MVLGDVRGDDLEAYRGLLEALEHRAVVLQILGEALGARDAFVRLGVDLPHPALQRASLVGATYGLAHRRLGAVSLLGPLRMDYETAHSHSVRGPPRASCRRFVEEIYADN